ncbi:MAG: rRNA maturation RNase YbeY [Rhodanobacter sp.]|nr:MAG: rRNA maturation RNase YbeY [Rhodanobacter sp.]TAL95021.1 MAG: rRNA maturation RNase YbeY [Rhodanobacter sp.]TAM43183.1 MAG: rRNA maturation RNase YbeY [Rhodanobacter sp.]TAN26477.1 MAG: rRNA maturation RNase YbeY [Rhodanobacter sp.]
MPTNRLFRTTAVSSSPRPSPAVHLGYAVSRAGVPSPISFRRWVEAALRGAKRRKATELSIRIVGADEGRALNRNYRSKDYATNVLSFSVELPPGMTLPLLGDLAICAPVVQREAVEQGKASRDHWAHLTIHGVLHLLGYDHVDDGDAMVMEALETRVLAGLGIADPYA